MRNHLVISFTIALAFLTAAFPVAGSEGRDGHNPGFQEFDAPGPAAPGPLKSVVPIVPDAAKPAATSRQSTQSTAVGTSVEPTQSSSLGPLSMLKTILAFLAPSKEDLENTMDSLMMPKDEPNARPGPHWPSRSAARGRF